MSAPGLGDVYAGRPDYGDDVAPCVVCGVSDELDERGECSTCHRDECCVCGDLAYLDDAERCPVCALPDCPYCGDTMTVEEAKLGCCERDSCCREDAAATAFCARES